MRRMGTSPPRGRAYSGHRRRRAWVIAGGLVLVVVALAVGLSLGRLTGAGPSGTSPGRPVTAGVPGVGATRVVAGVPVGYAQTQEGAAQAAGNYLVVLNGPLARDRARANAALAEIAEPSARARLEKDVETASRGYEELWGVQSAIRQGKRVVLTLTPIAYRVDSYTPQEALVRLWVATTAGVENRQRLIALFGISSVTLTCLNGDWRLRNMDAGTKEADVVPACLQTPTETGGVPAKLDGFLPYGG